MFVVKLGMRQISAPRILMHPPNCQRTRPEELQTSGTFDPAAPLADDFFLQENNLDDSLHYTGDSFVSSQRYELEDGSRALCRLSDMSLKTASGVLCLGHFVSSQRYELEDGFRGFYVSKI